MSSPISISPPQWVLERLLDEADLAQLKYVVREGRTVWIIPKELTKSWRTISQRADGQ